MFSPELNSPVRMQVDVTPPPGFDGQGNESWIDDPAWEEAVAALISGGLFFLQVGYPGASPRRWGRFRDLSARAVEAGIRVTVVLAENETFPVESITPGVAEAVMDVSLSAGGPDLTGRLASFAEMLGRLEQPPRAGALFRPRSGELGLVDKVMEASGRAGLDLLELPPPPLVYAGGDNESRFVPGPAEYRELASRPSANVEAGASVDLRVHDVLLWMLLNRRRPLGAGAGERFGGCQAASALAYVRSDGTVFPCAALRMPLGSVTRIADPEFWRGGEPAVVRRAVAGAREVCSGCQALESCRGGCPGTRPALSGSWRSRGLLCDIFEELAGAGEP